MKWMDIKPMENGTEVEHFEKQIGALLPMGFRACMMRNNGGCPERTVFKTKDGSRSQIGYFLSFNRKDEDSIWDIQQKITNTNCIPFARDTENHLICFNKNFQVVLLVTEGDEISTRYIAEDWSAFIGMLRR